MKRTTLQYAICAVLPALVSGCYVLPVGSADIDRIEALVRQAHQQQLRQAQPAAPSQASAPLATPAAAASQPASAPASTVPTVIQARLYPMNEIATENGMLSGTVTNMMNGKGRLQLSYRGEQLIGEATRVANDQSKGVASAWGPNGSFMSCEYQMSSPLRGAGTCSFSDGARYQVHVGN
jgi:hypothetical protein